MTVVRDALTNWTGGEQESGPTYRLTFDVTTNSPADGPQAVRAYMFAKYGYRKRAVYAYGAESDPLARATTIDVTPVSKTPKHWTYEIAFSSADESDTDNPLDQPAKFERGVEHREQVVERDIHGRPIANSAGDRFDEVITQPDTRTVVRVSKNFAAWPQSNYRLMNTVNRRPYELGNETYERRQVRLSDMRDSGEYSDTLKDPITNPLGIYYAVSLEFTFAHDDWNIVMKDQGLWQSYRQYRVLYGYQNADGTWPTATIPARNEAEARAIFAGQSTAAINAVIHIANARVPCRVNPPALPGETACGEPTTIPLPLNGAGRQIATPGEPPVFLEFEGFLEFDFNLLNL